MCVCAAVAVHVWQSLCVCLHAITSTLMHAYLQVLQCHSALISVFTQLVIVFVSFFVRYAYFSATI